MTDIEYAPYKRLGAAVFGNAINGANEVADDDDGSARRDIRNAKSFLLQNKEDFTFWCEVVGCCDKRMRNIIKKKLPELAVQRKRAVRRIETTPRNRLTNKLKKEMLEDMRRGFKVTDLVKKYGMRDCSCYYYSNKYQIPLLTNNGWYTGEAK